MSLYAIQTEISLLINGILEGGADSIDAQAAFDEHLAALDEVLDDKADGYAAVIRELETRSVTRRAEAARMRELAAVDDSLAERLKTRLKQAMEATGKLRIETPRFRLSVTRNGGPLPLSITCQPTELPSRFQTTTITADKVALRTAIEGGLEVHGVEVLPRTSSLRIL